MRAGGRRKAGLRHGVIGKGSNRSHFWFKPLPPVTCSAGSCNVRVDTLVIIVHMRREFAAGYAIAGPRPVWILLQADHTPPTITEATRVKIGSTTVVRRGVRRKEFLVLRAFFQTTTVLGDKVRRVF